MIMLGLQITIDKYQQIMLKKINYVDNKRNP